MTSNNTLAITAIAKNEASGPIKEIADDFEAFGNSFSDAYDKIDKAQETARKDVVDAFKAMKKEVLSFPIAINEAFSVSVGTVLTGAAEISGAIKDAVVDAAHGLFDLAKGAADAGDQAFTMSQRVGASATFLTQMGYAARLSGTDVGALERGMRGLSARAIAGKPAFKQWGVAVEDANGHLKTSEQLFYDAADRISSLENPLERAAAAQDLFGKGGGLLLPLLEEGSSGLREMAERADALGITINDASAALGDHFNDELTTTNEAIEGLARTTGEVFEPALIDGFKAVQEVVIEFRQALEDNNTSFKELASGGIEIIVGAIRIMGDVVVFATKHFTALKFAAEGMLHVVPGFEVAADIFSAMGAAIGYVGESAQETEGAMMSMADGSERSLSQLKKDAEEEKKLAKEKAKAEKEWERSADHANKERERIAEAAQKKAEHAAKVAEARRQREAKAEERAGQAKWDRETADYDRMIERDTKREATAQRKKDREAKHAEDKDIKEAEKLQKRKSKEIDRAIKLQEDAHKKAVKDLTGDIADAAKGTIGIFKNAIGEAIAGTKKGSEILKDIVLGILGDIAEKLAEFAIDQIAAAIAEGILDRSKIAANAAVAASGAAAAVAGIPFVGPLLAPSAAAAAFTSTMAYQAAVPLAEGGIVEGGVAGRDSVHALLMPDEAVLPVSMVRSLRRLLGAPGGGSGTMPGFADGGIVAQRRRQQAPQQVNLFGMFGDRSAMRRWQRDVLEPDQKVLRKNRIIKDGGRK